MLKYYYKIIQLIETILNILIVFVFNIKYIFKKTCFPVKKVDSIQILGNGPSLKDDIPKVLETRENSAVMVVNSFAATELYEQLKPEYYVIVDPAFFEHPTNDRIKKVQEKTANALIEKTNWDLNLLVPYQAKKSSFIKRVRSSSDLISVFYFNNIPVIGGSQKMNTFLFKKGFANPLFQNVLICGLFIGVKMKFKNIFLWGADHSWHEDFKLSDDNFIYTPDKHFYDTPDKNNYFIHAHDNGTPKKVHEEFFVVARTFAVYHSIEHYSKAVGSEVFNLSSKTWIDAFKRKQ